MANSGTSATTVVTFILLAASSAASAQREPGARTIEMGTYVVTVPTDGWRIKTDTRRGTIECERKNPLTIMHISRNWVAEQSMWQMSAEEIANDYRGHELADMMIRGPRERRYAPDRVKEDTAVIDGRKLYTLTYRTVGQPFGGPNGQATLYLYFPPSFKESHTFYMFLMHVVTDADSASQVDFEPIQGVIRSFQLR